MANTVSLDVSRRLKAAGLVWEPEVGDWFLIWLPADKRYLPKPELYDTGSCYIDREDIWLPGLSDILSRLRERGIMYHFKWDGGKHEIKVSDGVSFVADYEADTPEDAAGLALIWALGQEGVIKCPGSL